MAVKPDDAVLLESERDIERAMAIESYIAQIESSGRVTPDDIVALESLAPGVLMDRYPAGGYHGRQYQIAVENLSMFKGLLIAGALLAMFRYIWKLIQGDTSDGDSAGGGSGGGRDYERDVSQLESSRQSVEASQSAASDKADAIKAEEVLKEMEAAKNMLRGLGMSDAKMTSALSSASAAKAFFFGHGFLDEVFIYAAQDCNVRLVTDSDYRQKQDHLTSLFMEMTGFVEERMQYVLRCLQLIGHQMRSTVEDLSKSLDNTSLPPEVSPNFLYPDLPEDKTGDLMSISKYMGAGSRNTPPRELCMELYNQVDELLDGGDYYDFLKTVKGPAQLQDRLDGIVRLNVALGGYTKQYRTVFGPTYTRANTLVDQLKREADKAHHAHVRRLLAAMQTDLHRITMYTGRMVMTADLLQIFCTKALGVPKDILSSDEKAKRFFNTIGDRYSKMYLS